MRIVVRLGAAFAVACCTMAVAPLASAAPAGLIVWAPAPAAAVIRDQLSGGFRGVPVTVVTKDASTIVDDLQTVDLVSAPDVIWVDAAQTGLLVGDRVVKPVPLSSVLRARFPSTLLGAFRYGFADYGIPVTVENVALVVNLDLVARVPQTFGELERASRRLLAARQVSVGLAVGQGEPGQEYLLGPLFTGLGGYLFGKNAAGGLDPYNVGLSTSVLQENAERIDDWNDDGLVSSDLTAEQAQRAFVAGRAAFWIVGPKARRVIDDLPFQVSITGLPPIVDGIVPAPFLKVEGPMVTVYSDRHGVGDLAVALVRRHFGQERVQSDLAQATVTAPALRSARVSRAVAAFAAAGQGGTPLPNIGQAAAIWGPFRQAWAVSTSGRSALPAGPAFAQAQRSALSAIG